MEATTTQKERTMQTARHLVRTSARQFSVIDGGTRKGTVWCAADDLAADGSSKRWRASNPTCAFEYHEWRFFKTPQAAAAFCVEQYDRRNT